MPPRSSRKRPAVSCGSCIEIKTIRTSCASASFWASREQCDAALALPNVRENATKFMQLLRIPPRSLTAGLSAEPG